MSLFNRAKQKQDIKNTLQEATDVQESAKIKVAIAKKEAEKLQRLIKRATKNKDVTLTIFLATGGDRRIK